MYPEHMRAVRAFEGSAVQSRSSATWGWLLHESEGSGKLDRARSRAGGGGGPDYLQKLKVPEGYDKIIDYSNI